MIIVVVNGQGLMMNNRNFEKAVNQIIKIEGGFVNNPKDKGGATKYGITEKVARQNGYIYDIKNLTQVKAKEIYKNEYWDKIKVDCKNFNISFLLFDFAVNSGVKTAIKHLQNALNVLLKGIIEPLIIDGVAGKKTQAAMDYINANGFFSDKLQSLLINERLKFYTSLSKTQFNEFGKGWINRIISNIDFLNGL